MFKTRVIELLVTKKTKTKTKAKSKMKIVSE